MRYMGNKTRFLKHIIPILMGARAPGQPFYDIFTGSASVVAAMDGERHAVDANPYMIALFHALQKGWAPPDMVSEDEYRAVRLYPEAFAPGHVAFVMAGCSFGGKWGGGYARGPCGRNHAGEVRRSLLRQVPKIVGVRFVCSDYAAISFDRPSLIYCDPPYAGTTGYKKTIVGKFSPSVFWDWCRIKALEGHTVFVSESVAPDDFKCVMEVPIKKDRCLYKSRFERLFTYGKRD